jgi:hypothetical protein
MNQPLGIWDIYGTQSHPKPGNQSQVAIPEAKGNRCRRHHALSAHGSSCTLPSPRTSRCGGMAKKTQLFTEIPPKALVINNA